jgi:hypothetical protein
LAQDDHAERYHQGLGGRIIRPVARWTPLGSLLNYYYYRRAA